MEDTKRQSLYSETSLVDEFTKNRNILLAGPVTSELAMHIMIIMLKLEQLDPYAPINLYIDSPGGDVRAGLTIIDTMNSIKPPVNTFCYSTAASMGAVILSAGAKRYAFEHSIIMIHQPLSSMEGFYRQTDLSKKAKSLEKVRDDLEHLLASYTKGKTSLEQMHIACEEDNYMSPDQALEMGLIDEIIRKDK